MNEIKIDLRSGINLGQMYTQEHQDENVTVYAFEWMKEALKILRKSIDKEILVNIEDCKKQNFLSSDLSLKDLQIISRNESSNINGEINFANYSGISKEVVYSLKDLSRQTVIVGLLVQHFYRIIRIESF